MIENIIIPISPPINGNNMHNINIGYSKDKDIKPYMHNNNSDTTIINIVNCIINKLRLLI